MVLEIPCRIIIFAIGFFSLLTLVGWILFFLTLNLLREFTGVVPATDTTDLYVVLLVVFGKLVVEWSQFQAALTDDPSGFSSWFVPFDPREL